MTTRDLSQVRQMQLIDPIADLGHPLLDRLVDVPRLPIGIRFGQDPGLLEDLGSTKMAAPPAPPPRSRRWDGSRSPACGNPPGPGSGVEDLVGE